MRSRSRSPSATPTACIGPSPLYRAHRLEQALDTPAHIYYKYEGVSPAGSHKPNTALPQAFYNKEAGVKRIATETGAGQWGSAMAFAGAMFGLEVKVYMVRAELRPEAVPPDPDGDVRRRGRRQPVADDELRPGRARRDAGQPGLARDGDQRGGRGRRDPRRHEVRPRVRAEPRAAAPDGHRPGSHRADGHGRRVAGCRHRAARAAARTSPG